MADETNAVEFPPTPAPAEASKIILPEEEKKAEDPKKKDTSTYFLMYLPKEGTNVEVVMNYDASLNFNKERECTLADAYRMVCDAKLQLEAEMTTTVHFSKVAMFQKMAQERESSARIQSQLNRPAPAFPFGKKR